MASALLAACVFLWDFQCLSPGLALSGGSENPCCNEPAVSRDGSNLPGAGQGTLRRERLRAAGGGTWNAMFRDTNSKWFLWEAELETIPSALTATAVPGWLG